MTKTTTLSQDDLEARISKLPVKLTEQAAANRAWTKLGALISEREKTRDDAISNAHLVNFQLRHEGSDLTQTEQEQLMAELLECLNAAETHPKEIERLKERQQKYAPLAKEYTNDVDRRSGLAKQQMSA